MKLQALTTVVGLAFCSLQALALPALFADTRDISNGTSTSAGTYTVVAGDTLDAIAAAEGTTTEQLEAANPGVEPTDLEVGEVLNLPAVANSTATSLTPLVSARQLYPRQNTYTVGSGDTLDEIAAKEGISTEQLEDANPGVEPADLQVGQVLNVPTPASAPSASPAPAAASPASAATSLASVSTSPAPAATSGTAEF